MHGWGVNTSVRCGCVRISRAVKLNSIHEAGKLLSQVILRSVCVEGKKDFFFFVWIYSVTGIPPAPLPPPPPPKYIYLSAGVLSKLIVCQLAPP